MFKTDKKFTFSMGHALAEPYKGACQDVHGHNYEVTIAVRSLKVDEVGFVMDVQEIGNSFGQWLKDHLDHRTMLAERHPLTLALGLKPNKSNMWVRQQFGFVIVPFNPTSENLAKALHGIAADLLNVPAEHITINVRETATISATYELEVA